jgi:predicted HicB family RNase H-like nuclease
MPESVVHFQIRMPPQQHEKLATWAKEDKVSLNLLVVGLLEKAMERRKAEHTTPKTGAAHTTK